MIAIADTGFLVAFASARDRFHDWAHELAPQLAAPLLTCEAVLSETAFNRRSSSTVLEMIALGFVRVEFNVTKNGSELLELAKTYADRKPDLADLCIIRLSELQPKLPVLTVDADFRVYRRYRREIIPTIMPRELP